MISKKSDANLWLLRSIKVILYGVPAVGGLKFSMAQKNFARSASCGQKFNPSTDDFFLIL